MSKIIKKQRKGKTVLIWHLTDYSVHYRTFGRIADADNIGSNLAKRADVSAVFIKYYKAGKFNRSVTIKDFSNYEQK